MLNFSYKYSFARMQSILCLSYIGDELLCQDNEDFFESNEAATKVQSTLDHKIKEKRVCIANVSSFDTSYYDISNSVLWDFSWEHNM